MKTVAIFSREDIEKICNELISKRIVEIARDYMKELECRIPPQGSKILNDNDSFELLTCSVRLHNILVRNEIKTIGDICSKTEMDFWKRAGFGRSCMLELKTRLAVNGLKLKE